MKHLMRIATFVFAVGLGATFAGAQGSPYLVDRESGKFLGYLNSNPFDPDSVSNPYGRYGSVYSPDSINNPYGRYGSPYGRESARNPFGFGGPVIVAPGGFGWRD